VEDEIRQRLAVEDAEELVNDLYVRVEDAVAGGATVGEIAARFDLPARTVSLVSSQGVDPEGRDVDAPQSILSTAFQVAPGADAEPVHMDDTYAWVQTTTVKDAADRPFEEVRGEVLVAWTEAQKTERLADAAADALERVENGVPLDTVAADLGVAAQTTDPFSRREPPQGLPQPVANAAFEGPLGHAGSVIAGEGRHVVFEVTNVSEPAFFEESAELRPIRQNLNDQLANTLLTEFLTAYQADVGATQNPTVINQIVGIEERTR
jgi:peptidyl-prolyl cis-trans isomerase D